MMGGLEKQRTIKVHRHVELRGGKVVATLWCRLAVDRVGRGPVATRYPPRRLLVHRQVLLLHLHKPELTRVLTKDNVKRW